MVGTVRRGAAVIVVLGLMTPVLVSWGPALARHGPVRSVLTAGDVDVDIDGDGRADLIIGSLQAIQVLDGDGERQRITAGSLRPRHDYVLFGFRIVACDVNGDGYSDAVVAAPWDGLRPEAAGRVVVLYGAAAGLSPRRLSVLSQSTPGVPGNSEAYDQFGASIECGRINADRFDDVVVGTTGESWPGRTRRDLGRVVVVPGGADGVVPARAWAFNQDSRGIPDRSERGDGFGSWLLIDDVTGDGWDELIVGSIEDNATDRFTAALFSLPGTARGVRLRGTTMIQGLTGGLPRLWGPVVVGNFDRRGPRDLVVSFEPGDVRARRCDDAAGNAGGSVGKTEPDDQPGLVGHASSGPISPQSLRVVHGCGRR